MAQQPTAPTPPQPKAGEQTPPKAEDPKDVRIRELEEKLAKSGPHPNIGPAAANPYAPTPPIAVPADWVPGQEGQFAKERRLAAEKEAKEPKEAKPA